MALVRTNLITAISADTFGTGNYTPGTTFDPASGKLLIGIGFAIQETDAGMEGSNLAISDSGGTLGWDRKAVSISSPGWSYGASIWAALPTANASGLSLTIGSGGLNAHNYRLTLDQISGINPRSYIRQAVVGTAAAGGAATIQFGNATLTTSLVIAVACIPASAGNISVTPGADFSEISDANSAGWAGYQVQERTGSTSRDVSWVDLDATGTASGAVLLAIEISQYTGSTEIHWPTQWDWKPQRWDFPLGTDLLLDDFLPSDTPAGDMTGATTLSFTNTGVLTGTGALVGAATITFSPTATIQGFAPITGATTLTFTNAGVIAGIGALAGATTLTFTPSATLIGSGALVGAATLTFAPSAVLTGTGALVGATTLTFAPTAVLTGTGSLSGAATITFTASGTLADAGGGGNLTGSSTFTFTAVGILTGTGDLAGSTTLTFSPSGVLTDSSAVIADTPVTGGGFFFDYEYHASLRRKRRRDREKAEEEAKRIQDALDREIAELLHEQEAKDIERKDFERIQALADKYAGKAMREGLPRRVSTAILKAQEERTRNSLEQMQREIERMLDDEGIALMMILNQSV